MNEQKLKGLLGLCVRARQGIFGGEACLNAVRTGKAALLLVDEGCSGQTMDRYRAASTAHRVRMETLRRDLLWEATGKPGKAMAVPAGGFADGMLTILTGSAGDRNEDTEILCGGADVE